MAKTTDVLETLLRLVGGPAYQTGLRQAGVANVQFGKAADEAKQKTENLERATEKAAEATKNRLAYGISTAVGVIGLAFKVFTDYQTQLTRASNTLKNLGTNFPTADLDRFAMATGRATATSSTQVLALTAQLAGYRMTREQIERTVPVIINTARRTGFNYTYIAEQIMRATKGQVDSLLRLGIVAQSSHAKFLPLNSVLGELEKRSKGMAQAFLASPEGALEGLKASTERLLIAFGRTVAPILVPVFNRLSAALEKLAGSSWLWRLINPFPGGGVKAGGMGFGGNVGAEAGGPFGGDFGAGAAKTASDRFLREIAFNTSPQGPMIKAIRGNVDPAHIPHMREFNMAFKYAR